MKTPSEDSPEIPVYPADTRTDAEARMPRTAAAPGTGVAVKIDRAEIEALLAPHTIDLRTWLKGILSDEEFPEQDAEEMTIGMLASILLAPTSEQALAALDLDRAKQMCGDEPGGKSPVLMITGARPMKSTIEGGAACYVIVEATKLDGGESIRFTTGSRAVQTMIWKHMAEGWMPFKAMLEIRREKTQAGYHPLNLIAGV